MAIRASDLLTLAVLPSPSYVRQFYRKQASTLSPPPKPTTNPPAAPWSTTEPTYTSGSTDTLYTVMLTAYGSVAFDYGEVQKSSSFEAAKQAYNRSDAAVIAAGNAADAATTAFNKAVSAESNAKDYVDEQPKILHSTNNPSGVAPNGSVWWKHKSLAGGVLGEVLGQWNYQNGWKSTPIDAQAIANLHVGYLTAGTASIDEAVLGKVWSELGVFERLTVGAEGAWIDGTVIKDNQVDAKHINATESLTTKIFGAEHGVIEYLTATQKALFLAGLDAIGESWIDGVNIKDGQITAKKMDFVKANSTHRLRLDDDGIIFETLAGKKVITWDASGLRGFNPAGQQTFYFDPTVGRLNAVDGKFSGDIDGATIEGSLVRSEAIYANGNYHWVEMGPEGIAQKYAPSLDDPWPSVTFWVPNYGSGPMAEKMGVNYLYAMSGDKVVVDTNLHVKYTSTHADAVTSFSQVATMIDKSSSSWEAITRLNGWGALAAYSPLGARRLPGGNVQLRGVVTPGTITSALGKLPGWFWPKYDQLLTVTAWYASSKRTYRLHVSSTNGEMTMGGLDGNPSWVSLDGLIFPTE